MKLAGKVLAVAMLLLIVAAAAAWIYLQRSLPQLDGEARVRGPAASVEIVRDKEGVPHLFAKSDGNGWFAMGYVHAQDPLWQMEFQRRIAAGGLSEFLGARAYQADKLMRT